MVPVVAASRILCFTDCIALFPLVDRILRQQKAEREAAERANRASLVSSSETIVQDTQTKTLATGMKTLPPTPNGAETKSPTQSTGAGLEQILKHPTSAITDLGRLLHPNRFNNLPTSPPRGGDVVQPPMLDARDVSPSPNPNIPKGASLQPNSGPSMGHSGGAGVTPLSNIGAISKSDAPELCLIPSFLRSQQYRHGD